LWNRCLGALCARADSGSGARKLFASDISLLGHLQRIVDFDAQVAHRAFDLAVTEQQLDGSQVLGPPVGQGGFGARHGVRSTRRRIEAQACDPAAHDAGVLERSNVLDGAASSGEERIGRLQSRLVDPRLGRFPGRSRNLQLHWPLRFALQHAGPGRNAVSVADAPNTQRRQVAASQLADDADVKKGQIPASVVQLQADPDCPDFLRLKQKLLSNQFALVPSLVLPADTFRIYIVLRGLLEESGAPTNRRVPARSTDDLPDLGDKGSQAPSRLGLGRNRTRWWKITGTNGPEAFGQKETPDVADVSGCPAYATVNPLTAFSMGLDAAGV